MKLTLVRIIVNGYLFNEFMLLPTVGGKTILPDKLLCEMYKERTGNDMPNYSRYSIG